jgi:hypothetical protein
MNALNDTIEIEGSPAKLLGLVGLGVIMTTASGAIVLGFIPNVEGSFVEFIGWVGLLFFGACMLIGLWRLFTFSKTVVTLLPEGLLDTRVAQRPIPWSAMEDIGVWSSNGQKIIVIAVPLEVEQGLGLTRMVKMTRSANAKLGADGLCIASTGLKIAHDKLLGEIIARVDAAKLIPSTQNSRAAN